MENLSAVYADSKKAFDDAIAAGRLSSEPSNPLYAGNYMYMGLYNNKHNFKNIITRQYAA